MTFYEAAIEVLRRSGRPLHYKKITEIAVRENLLSHVGKTPHLTMSDRLEKEVNKNAQSAIGQTRPGVFELEEEHAEELTEKVREKRKAQKKRQKKRQRDSSGDSGGGGGDKNGHDHHKRRRSRGSKDDGSASKTTTKKKKKKRRRRSKKDKKKRSPEQKGGDSQQKSKSKSDSDDDGQPRRRRRRRDDSTSDSESQTSRSAQTSAPSTGGDKHLQEGPVRLKGIPKAAHRVLTEHAPNAMSLDELSTKIFDKKLVKFHTHDQESTVKSALKNDNQIRRRRGHRPLFAHDDRQNWWLTEWDLADDVHQKEQAVLSLTEEIRQDSIRQLGQALLDIKAEALEHLALTLLERLGYYNIKVSKRSSEGDVFFTADWRQGLADVRVCVRVVTDHNRTLQQDSVVELRETLDHYAASEGVIIHLGSVSDGAVDKARLEGKAPITLLDRQTFVELLIKHGIGVKTYDSPIVTVDSSFVDALSN